MRSGREQSKQPSEWRHDYVEQYQQSPLEGVKHCVKNDEDQEHGNRQYQKQSRVRPLLARVLSRPIDVIALRKFHILVHLGDRFQGFGPVRS